MGRVAIVVFPGTNCEHDVQDALLSLGVEGELVWHTSGSLEGFDGVVVPGGFAHGDYLRPGAIGRFSPVMSAVTSLAISGRPVIGVCNGFQILTEAGLLPGALQKNAGLTFLCETVKLEITSVRSALTDGLVLSEVLQLPINHFEGNYTCDADVLASLLDNDQVVLRYVENPNGSVDAIAGVCNIAGNVVGLMPHPERATNRITGELDGERLFKAFAGRL